MHWFHIKSCVTVHVEIEDYFECVAVLEVPDHLRAGSYSCSRLSALSPFFPSLLSLPSLLFSPLPLILSPFLPFLLLFYFHLLFPFLLPTISAWQIYNAMWLCVFILLRLYTQQIYSHMTLALGNVLKWNHKHAWNVLRYAYFSNCWNMYDSVIVEICMIQ